MFEIEGIMNKRVENCHDCSYAQDNNLYLSSVRLLLSGAPIIVF